MEPDASERSDAAVVEPRGALARRVSRPPAFTSTVLRVGGRARTTPGLAVKDVASLRRCAVRFAHP
jgi:hypothetical protein